MGKLGPVQEQTMEEILASIRRMISEGDVSIAEPRAAEPRLAEARRPISNVARLFAEQPVDPDPAEEGIVADNVVELAMTQALEDAEAEMRSEPDGVLAGLAATESEPEPPSSLTAPPSTDRPAAEDRVSAPVPDPGDAPDTRPARAAAGPLPVRPSVADDRRAAPLLSARTDAMVSGAFNQLATTMLSGSTRTIDALVEDLLRPMLQNWLDLNLPPLVERLVREEIERVSRGRR
jgi:cell pole-organizing protein PopZ